MTSNHEQMSSIDTAWLRMERPTNLMMIMGILIFEGKLDFQRFKEEIVEGRFLTYKRFKQRTLQDGRHAYWEDDPNFDVSRHVHRTALPGAAGKAELEELASDLRSTPLDFSKPLWQFHLVENYHENGMEGSAFIMRIHHCYADGIAMIHVLLSLTETDPKDSLVHIEEELTPSKDRSLLKRVIEPLNEFVDHTFKTFKWGQDLLEEGVEIVRHPSNVLGYARQKVELALETAKIALMSNDPETCFKGKLGVNKCAAWSNPLLLREMKQVGQALGCSINDVTLACITGALRTYMLNRGQTPSGLEIRAVVPVNLRPDDQICELGNEFGLVLLTLPLGTENPIERLYQIRKYMQAIKNSYQADATFGLLGTLGFGPNMLEQSAIDLLSKKATTVMSNVFGPQQPLYMTGTPIKELMFWVPQTGSVSMGLSIISYNGHILFGTVTDERLVSDPQTIAKSFEKEFEKLLLVTLLEPWESGIDVKAIEKFVSES